jgi:hypothetical protein
MGAGCEERVVVRRPQPVVRVYTPQPVVRVYTPPPPRVYVAPPVVEERVIVR